MRDATEPRGEKSAGEASQTSSSDRWKRLAVTLASVGAWVALRYLRIELPDVDLSGAGALDQSEAFGVFALGLSPVLAAMVFVELAAVVIPRLRPLRHGGREGRAKLSRASAVVALVLAMLHGLATARTMESIPILVVVNPGWWFRLGTMLTLAAGTAIALLLAQLADVRGVVSGIGIIAIGGDLAHALHGLVRSVAEGRTTGRALAGYVASAFLVAGLTWLVLRDPRSEPGPTREPGGYREPVLGPAPQPLSIPAPASGIALLLVAPPAIGLARMAAGDRLLPTGVVVAAWSLLVVALGIACSRWFNAPRRIAGVLSRARAEGELVGGPARRDGDLQREGQRALRGATLRSLVFLGAIMTISRVVDAAFILPLDIALLTALLLDAAAELRARREMPDLVPVWPEHRPYAVAAAREALARANVPLFARGEKLRRLLQLAGPFVPIDLMVPRAHEKCAAAVLERVLHFHPDDEKDAPAATRAPRAPWAPTDRRLLAAAAVLAVVPVVVAAWPHGPPSRGAVRVDTLQVMEVDDDDDLFSPEPLDRPAGVSIFPENVPRGTGPYESRNYARIVPLYDVRMPRPPQYAADLAESGPRLLSWAEKLAAARGLSVRVTPYTDWNEARQEMEQVGWRTYLVRGAPILDARDVVEATPLPPTNDLHFGGWTVHVDLDAAGAERFRAYTAAHVKRRLAIVVDGTVESAPVILTEISGAAVSIAIGAGSYEEQRAKAKHLADRLMGR